MPGSPDVEDAGIAEATARRLLERGEKGEVGGVGRKTVGGGKRGAVRDVRRGGWMLRTRAEFRRDRWRTGWAAVAEGNIAWRCCRVSSVCSSASLKLGEYKLGRGGGWKLDMMLPVLCFTYHFYVLSLPLLRCSSLVSVSLRR